MGSAKPRRCACCNKAKPDVIRRGLCQACYRTAARSVSENEVTWDELVASGKARPSARRCPRSPMSKAIAALSGAHR